MAYLGMDLIGKIQRCSTGWHIDDITLWRKDFGFKLVNKFASFFNLLGLMKIKMIYKPAVPARKGINPFTKEEVIFKAKPARNVVKCQPLKSLKDMV